MFILNKVNSIANHFLAELRHLEIQKDSMRFRRNMERLGELMAYELSKTMDYEEQTIKTALGTAKVNLLKRQPVLVTILRAGIPFHQGFLNYFDQAESSFIGAYRTSHTGKEDFDIMMEYIAVNALDNRELILIDPMLASGKSIIKTLNTLLKYGTPAHIHVVAGIATPEGIDYINHHFTLPYTLWTAALDEKLNDKAYIVPGLGDAGDLSFGTKI